MSRQPRVREVIEVIDSENEDSVSSGRQSSDEPTPYEGESTSESDKKEGDSSDDKESQASSVPQSKRTGGGSTTGSQASSPGRRQAPPRDPSQPPPAPSSQPKAESAGPSHVPRTNKGLDKRDMLSALGFPSSIAVAAAGAARAVAAAAGAVRGIISKEGGEGGGAASGAEEGVTSKRPRGRPRGSTTKRRGRPRKMRRGDSSDDDDDEDEDGEEEEGEEDGKTEEGQEGNVYATGSGASSVESGMVSKKRRRPSRKSQLLAMKTSNEPTETSNPAVTDIAETVLGAHVAYAEEEGEEDDEEETFCEVCFRMREPPGNLIVLCGDQHSECSTAVHQSCYHVPTVPPDPQLWYCDLCRYVRWSRFCTKGPTRDRSFHVPEVICQLCGQNNRIKGAFIEVVAVSATGCVAKSRMQFVHKLCALAAQPYVKFIAGTDRQKVLGPIPDLPPATNACQLCHRKTGMVLTCSEPECPTAFHAICAARNGSLPDIQTSNHWQVKMQCPAHSLLVAMKSPPLLEEEGIPQGFDYVDGKAKILQEMVQEELRGVAPRKPTLIPLQAGEGRRFYAISPELAADLRKRMASTAKDGNQCIKG